MPGKRKLRERSRRHVEIEHGVGDSEASESCVPSFNFFFTQYYNGSTWQIEAAAEVFHVA